MNKFLAITVFTRVAEEGGFTAASRTLGISNSAVTKLVARLEANIGARLFYRTTRHLALTDQGKEFYAHCVRILEDLKQAESAISTANRSARGTVRALMPISFGRNTVIPALPKFYERCPEVSVELKFADEATDIMKDRFGLTVLARREGVIYPGLIRRRLVQTSLICVASPEYLARRGTPAVPADLEEHNCILNPGSNWLFSHGKNKLETVAARGNLTVWSGDALREAAVAGIGIAYSTRWLFRKDLENGSLVQILDRYQVAGPPHLVYYPPNPHLALRVRAFIDFLVEITRNRPA